MGHEFLVHLRGQRALRPQPLLDGGRLECMRVHEQLNGRVAHGRLRISQTVRAQREHAPCAQHDAPCAQHDAPWAQPVGMTATGGRWRHAIDSGLGWLQQPQQQLQPRRLGVPLPTLAQYGAPTVDPAATAAVAAVSAAVAAVSAAAAAVSAAMAFGADEWTGTERLQQCEEHTMMRSDRVSKQCLQRTHGALHHAYRACSHGVVQRGQQAEQRGARGREAAAREERAHQRAVDVEECEGREGDA